MIAGELLQSSHCSRRNRAVDGVVGSRALVIREVVANVPGLPKSFDGLRIAQVSDTHMGPQSHGFMDSVTRAWHTLQPEVVTVTGDLSTIVQKTSTFSRTGCDDHQSEREWAQARVYLVPGNHDV